MDPFSAIRATTVHPALVHVPLGVAPVMVLAYALAAARRSARWSFAGDVALWVGAAFAVAAAAAGLVANALVAWPAGLGGWRWLHLGGGLASTAGLLGLAAVRLRALRAGAVAGRRTLAVSAAVAVALGATGWVGGELLVFHAGVAVTAAGGGAFAPAVTRATHPPGDLDEAMARLRESWGEATAAHGRMLVDRPSAEGYARIAAAARELQRDAAWLEAHGPAALRAHGGEEAAATAAEMAPMLAAQASALADAAAARRWSGVTQSLGAITRTCAGCHEATRWTEAHPHGGER